MLARSMQQNGTHSLGVGGKDAARDEPLAFAVEVRYGLVEVPAGPWRRRVVHHPYGGTGRGPRRRRRGRRLAEAAEGRPWEGGEREDGRLAPQDLRSRDRRHSHRLDLDVGTQLVSVDLQEHVADAQGRALVVGDDDLDLPTRPVPSAPVPPWLRPRGARPRHRARRGAAAPARLAGPRPGARGAGRHSGSTPVHMTSVL